MTTYEEEAKKMFITNLGEKEIKTIDQKILHGHTDSDGNVIYPFRTAFEMDQKVLKPTATVYGADYIRGVEQLGEIYDKFVEVFEKKRGVPVAPITKLMGEVQQQKQPQRRNDDELSDKVREISMQLNEELAKEK